MIFTVAVIKSAYMGHRIMNGDNGFTYPAALLLILIVSVSLMVVQKQWSTIVDRDKEKELFFRAEQIVSAIESYYQKSSSQSQKYPRDFKVLIKDNRFPGTVRHLRKMFKDPITSNGDWGVIYDGRGGIKGVYSKSSKKPFKTKNFPDEYKTFENKRRYSDWKFVYEPKKEKNT